MLEVLLWVALWLLLLLAAGVVLFLITRSVYRKAALLVRELQQVSEQFSQVTEHLQAVADRTPQPAVFDSPSRLRQQRYRSRPTTGRVRRGGHDVR